MPFANYRFGALQPAASASATEQNQRFPLMRSIFTLAYQRLRAHDRCIRRRG
jgi:hypothetical protein